MRACAVPNCGRSVKARELCAGHYRWWLTHRAMPTHELRAAHHGMSIVERIQAQVQVDVNGCWVWLGSKDRAGYGQTMYLGKVRRAHRVSYEVLVAPIPEGLVLDHLCRNRSCVNPAHLEPVTQRENLRRGDTLNAANVLKTHCPRGHPYSGDNLYRDPTHGFRRCRACASEREANRERRSA